MSWKPQISGDKCIESRFSLLKIIITEVVICYELFAKNLNQAQNFPLYWEKKIKSPAQQEAILNLKSYNYCSPQLVMWTAFSRIPGSAQFLLEILPYLKFMKPNAKHTYLPYTIYNIGVFLWPPQAPGHVCSLCTSYRQSLLFFPSHVIDAKGKSLLNSTTTKSTVIRKNTMPAIAHKALFCIFFLLLGCLFCPLY